ncbi:MAG TPA: ROK family protein [Friedmanniella sp.]
MALAPADEVVGTGWPTLNQAERGALREVLIHGPIPRTEIAHRLGLSRASLTRVTRTLMTHGLVGEVGLEMRARTGRPSELLRARPDTYRLIGIKLTAEVLYAVVTDLTARVVDTVEQPIASRDFPDVVDQIDALVTRLRGAHPAVCAVGVCLAGDLVGSGTAQVVTSSPYLGWTDVQVTEVLTGRLGLPVTTSNDVRALTAAEHWFGAGAGCRSLALVTVGTGIGLGFVVDDKLVSGVTGRAGRLDHLRIDPSGPICGLGHRGCASVYLTSGAIAGSLGVAGVTYSDVVALAEQGRPDAVLAFREAGRALGVLIATVANALDPEKIVLTGDGLAVMRLAGDAVRESIAELRDPPEAITPLDVQPFDFTEWARAGAVAAIRSLVEPDIS